MNVQSFKFPGVRLIDPQVYKDDRGYFLETYHLEKYSKHNIPISFVQDNRSYSHKDVIRGLHIQIKYPQGKLVSVIHGEVFDVVVDVRRGSLFYGQWLGVNLSSSNHKQLYIPPGYAHGFCVLSYYAIVEYKCTDLYHAEDQITIAWNDPTIQIKWPTDNPVLSDKDKAGLFLTQIPNLPRLIEKIR